MNTIEKQVVLGLLKMLYNQEHISKEEYDNCLRETEKEFAMV